MCFCICVCFFFFFKQKTAYEIMPSLVGSEMCIRDRLWHTDCLFFKLEINHESTKKFVFSTISFIEGGWKPVYVLFRRKEETLCCQKEVERRGPEIYEYDTKTPVSYTHLRAHETR